MVTRVLALSAGRLVLHFTTPTGQSRCEGCWAWAPANTNVNITVSSSPHQRPVRKCARSRELRPGSTGDAENSNWEFEQTRLREVKAMSAVVGQGEWANEERHPRQELARSLSYMEKADRKHVGQRVGWYLEPSGKGSPEVLACPHRK